MKLLFSFAAAALVAVPVAQAASRGGAECGVTHHDCYPACVQMTPDGSDCAKTRQVCKDICGAQPSYPAITNTERADMQRFETRDYHTGNTTVLPSTSAPLAPDETTPPATDSTANPIAPSDQEPYATSPPNP